MARVFDPLDEIQLLVCDVRGMTGVGFRGRERENHTRSEVFLGYLAGSLDVGTALDLKHLALVVMFFSISIARFRLSWEWSGLVWGSR